MSLSPRIILAYTVSDAADGNVNIVSGLEPRFTMRYKTATEEAGFSQRPLQKRN